MKSIYKITYRTMLRKKLKSAFLLGSIIIATILLVATFFIHDSYIAFEEATTIYQNGDWQYQTHVNNEQYQILKNAMKDKQFMMIQQEGQLKNETNAKIYLKSITHLTKLLPLHLTQGKEPQTSSEIMIPLHMAEVQNIKIGDILSYTYVQDTLLSKKPIQMRMKVTGIVDDLIENEIGSDVVYTKLDDTQSVDALVYLGKNTLDQPTRNELQKKHNMESIIKNIFLTDVSFTIIFTPRMMLLAFMFVSFAVALALRPFIREIKLCILCPLQKHLHLPRNKQLKKDLSIQKRILSRYAFMQKRKNILMYFTIAFSVIVFLSTHVILQSSLIANKQEDAANLYVQVLSDKEDETFSDYQKRVKMVVAKDDTDKVNYYYELGMNARLAKSENQTLPQGEADEQLLQVYAIDDKQLDDLLQKYHLQINKDNFFILFTKAYDGDDHVKQVANFKNEKAITFDLIRNDGKVLTKTLPLTYTIDDISPIYTTQTTLLTSQSQLNKLISAYGFEHLSNYGKTANISFQSDNPNLLEQRLRKTDAHLLIDNKARISALYEGILLIFQGCVDLFVSMLFICSIAYIVNLLLANIKEREKDYAALLSLGLISKQLRYMIYYEYGKYLGIAYLGGVLVGSVFALGVQLLNKQSIEHLFASLFPIVGFIGIVFIILWMVLCHLMLKKIQKLNVLLLVKGD